MLEQTIYDLLPFSAGQTVETVLMGFLHPVDVLVVNVLFTLIVAVYSDEAYIKFVLGLWTQYVLLLLYDYVSGLAGEKKSVLLSALGTASP